MMDRDMTPTLETVIDVILNDKECTRFKCYTCEELLGKTCGHDGRPAVVKAANERNKRLVLDSVIGD